MPVAAICTRNASREEQKMALLKRELYRQHEGPQVIRKDLWTLVFDTDTKRLYVEHAWADLGKGEAECQTGAMEIAEYLTQGGQTAGHRELWRLLQTLFEESSTPGNHQRA
jgi:hypothetical protein